VTDDRSWQEERVAVEEQLRYMADHDPLTGLFNRRRLEEELERHFAHGRRYGMGGALLLLDLDDFKRVNDGFGHRAGDRVLTAVGIVLRHRLRETDIVARFGRFPHRNDALGRKSTAEELAFLKDGPRFGQ